MDNNVNIHNINNPHSLSVEMDYEGKGDNVQNTEEPNNSDDHSIQDHQEDEYKQSPEIEEEVVVESQSQSKPKSKRWEKERKAREEKYQLTQALAEERKRNLELQKYLNHSVDNNTMSNAQKAMADLEAAERAHAAALESNDALAAAKASTALIQANLAVERVANTRMYADENDDRASRINPAAYASTKLLNDWLSDNPEFDEDSNYFNPALVNKIGPLVSKLESKLKREGQSHLISSPVYFDIIDSIVSQAKSGKSYNRPVTAPVSSKNHNTQYTSGSRPVLTEQQKMVAAGCGMSEEQYASWLKKYEKQRMEQDNRSSYGY